MLWRPALSGSASASAAEPKAESVDHNNTSSQTLNQHNREEMFQPARQMASSFSLDLPRSSERPARANIQGGVRPSTGPVCNSIITRTPSQDWVILPEKQDEIQQ